MSEDLIRAKRALRPLGRAYSGIRLPNGMTADANRFHERERLRERYMMPESAHPLPGFELRHA